MTYKLGETNQRKRGELVLKQLSGGRFWGKRVPPEEKFSKWKEQGTGGGGRFSFTRGCQEDTGNNEK